MEYKDFNIGDVVLVHRLPPYYNVDSMLSPIIRNAIGCYYNHAAVIGMCSGELYIFEAFGKGFYPTTRLKDYLKTVGVKREICIQRLNDVNSKYHNINTPVIENRISSLIDKGYDIKSLIFYQLWYYFTKKWLGKTGEDSRNLVLCSEAIADIYIEIFPKPWLITPKDIMLEFRFSIIYESNVSDRIKFDSKHNNK